VILTVAMAVALGLAVGAAAWTIAGSRSVSVANRTTYVAAIHERIEAHGALVATGADRAYDPIEAHRMAVANAAASQVMDGLRRAIAQFGVLHGVIQDFSTLSRPAGRYYMTFHFLPLRIVDRIEVADTRDGIPLLIAKTPDWVRTSDGDRVLP